MTRTKKTDPAANEAPETDKFYLHQFLDGASHPICLQKPLTDHGKKLLWDEIDAGSVFELIDETKFNALRSDETLNLDKPSDAHHAMVCRLCDYEPPMQKIISCSEYFDHIFTSEEIRQLASEFSEATAKKSEYEEELKSNTQYLKSKITETTATSNRISQELARGKRTESVKCHWIFNTPCRGSKSLFRLDTDPKELVRVAAMTASDKQMTLDDIAAAKLKAERTVEEKPVTEVDNEPYDGEILTDKEMAKEAGEE